MVRSVYIAALFALAFTLPAESAESVNSAIRARLAASGATLDLAGIVANTAELRAFYGARDFRPAWVTRIGRSAGPRARAALAVLEGAGTHGLETADYAVGRITAAMTAATENERAALDMSLSAVLMDYGSDLHAGRIAPDAVDANPRARPPGFDRVAVLSGAAAARGLQAYFDGLAPRGAEYRRLRAALARYRQIAAGGGWPTVADGELLRPGMVDGRVPALRRRLAATGDLADTGAGGDLYDDGVVAAVRRFQNRHGLAVDGIVGPRTRAALNETADSRVRRIGLNLERRRWMTADPGRRYIFVNTADFALKVVDGGKTVLDMRVIVGAPYRRTPVFGAALSHIEFHPYWNIPASIARQEIAPRALSDPAWLGRQGIRIIAGSGVQSAEIRPDQVDWAAAGRTFPYRLRQDPGPLNPLGRVKFALPNRFDVYLHDTPSRDLFDRDVRAFSHGCIRIEKPLALAAWLLRSDGAWSEDLVDEAMNGARTRTVRLARPVPVYLTYLTAWVNRDGSVNFRRDIYGRDARLAAALRRASGALTD